MLTIACQREFKNAEGNYDTDFIEISCWGFVGNVVKEHFHKGDTISVKGRLVQGQNGQCHVIGERLILISKKEVE